MITPLYDGMNLVSKEYIVSKPNGGSNHILSEGAGAATELVEAIIVNPNNVGEVAEAIRKALEMNQRRELEECVL